MSTSSKCQVTSCGKQEVCRTVTKEGLLNEDVVLHSQRTRTPWTNKGPKRMNPYSLQILCTVHICQTPAQTQPLMGLKSSVDKKYYCIYVKPSRDCVLCKCIPDPLNTEPNACSGIQCSQTVSSSNMLAKFSVCLRVHSFKGIQFIAQKTLDQ